MSNLQKYGSWGVEVAEKKAKEIEESGSGDLPPFLKLSEGKTHVRFLPPASGQNTPFVEVYQHFIRGDDPDQKLIVFNCPKRMLKKKCPACEVGDQLFRSGRHADKERAKKYWPKRRIWANVLEVGDEEEGVKAFAFGVQIFESLLALRTDAGDFTDPKKGFEIIITRKGTGIKTKYEVLGARGDAPLPNDDWIDELHDLQAIFGRVPTFDEAEGKMNDLDEDEEDDESESADDDLHDDIEDAEIVD
jgi:hypothetical protein